MNLEKQTKDLQKYEKKKKWDDAAKIAVEIADYYVEEQKNFQEALKYLERAISARQREKRAEAVIVLYRRIINVARRGKNKTQKELFRYAASAIPIVEEYIKVLVENEEYMTKNGALTRYFLGECRETVSGISQRNKEFLLAGKVFVEVGKKLATSKKTEHESEEAFEKSRIIFSLMKNQEETFESLLAEAELNTRKNILDKGFYLFEEARNLFDDQEHNIKVINIEKTVYADLGLELLENNFSDPEKRELAETLITRSKAAHLQAQSLQDFSKILIEVGRIYLNNDQLETAFTTFDDALQSSSIVGDETVPNEIIEYLYSEGTRAMVKLIHHSSKTNFEDPNTLLPMRYFNKISDICKETARDQKIESVAIYIREIGKQLINQGLIVDDFVYIKKAVDILVSHSRFAGIHKITDELDNKIDELLDNNKVFDAEKLEKFLVKTFLDISEKEAAGQIKIKFAKYYSRMGNYEKELEYLLETSTLFQHVDPPSLQAYAKTLEELFEPLKSTIFQSDFINILGNVYLALDDGDKYDSLYSQQSLFLLENDQVDEALSLYSQNFEYLRRMKNISRAMSRSNTMIERLREKRQYTYMIPLIHNQVNFLIQEKAEHEDVIPVVQRLEALINRFLANDEEFSFIDPVYTLITNMYDFIGIKEAQGDSAFEISVHFFEKGINDRGFEYLGKAFNIFLNEQIMEKIGLILDYVENRKNHHIELDSSDPMAGRYLEFLISCLIQLKQDADAANLMLEKAIQLIPLTESLAFRQFRAARSIISQIGTIEEVVEFDKSFGSALLKYGKTDQGIEFLADTEQKTSIDSLSLADTYLTNAKDRFAESDYDTYFTLVDQALSIYADLEMLQEASSIALAEARKLWSVNNIAYTMIFLERAWEPLSRVFTTEVTLSIQPITQVSMGFINELFSQKRFDEALGFIELLERIYKHFNRTDKILEIERKKVEAFIGRGNYEGAISKVYDVVNLGIDDFKINEVAILIHDFLPYFFQYAPGNSKDLLKLYFKLLIGSTSPNSSLVRETVEKYINLVFETLSRDEKELFYSQLTLIIKSISEIPEAGSQAIFLLINVINRFIQQSLFKDIVDLLDRDQDAISSLLPGAKLEFIKQLNPLITSTNIPEETIVSVIPWIGNLAGSLNDEEKDIAAIILFNIGNAHQKKKKIKIVAHEEALKVSQGISSALTTFKLLESQFRSEFSSSDYIKSLEILDKVIAYLSNQTASKEIAINFINLLNELLPDLGRRKKKKWLDLFTEKYQLISTKFLGEQNKVSTADEQYSEQLLDEMMDFTSQKDKK
ncbi:hypothetical protein CEE45_14500 [Candidatus Heimdallarchaeota archaeon B3_Heim]|nr:MAG: hypothetical protein CEE45_14500 [Candidatus Heimdallarchaeota archaeon B3_Heim]